MRYFKSINVLLFISIFYACSNNSLSDRDNYSSTQVVRKIINDEIEDCKDDADIFSPIVPISSRENIIPYDNMDSYAAYGVLDYQFARDYAYAELRANLDLYFPEQICIDLDIFDMIEHPDQLLFASRPVIVYDYNNRPYYYEFPLIFNNKIVSTVTVAAQPHSEELIHYVFPATILYSTYDFQYNRYIGEYPSVYYGYGDGTYYKPKECNIDSECLELVVDEYLINDPYESLLYKYADIPTEERTLIDSVLQEDPIADDGTEIYNLETLIYNWVFPTDYSDFWLAKVYRYHLSNSEFEVPSTCQFSPLSDAVMIMIEEQLNEITNSVTGFLSEYDNNYLRLTTWADACGPAIMSWLYRGKYDNFRDFYLPIYGDGNGTDWRYLVYPTHSIYAIGGEAHEQEDRREISSAIDNGLYYEFYKETIPAGSGDALYQGGMRRGLEYVTNGEYSIKFIVAPIKWMETQQQPVVVEGIRGKAHYWGAIGYGYSYTWLGTKKNLRLLVTDNGYMLKSHNYYPYWSILGGLNYGWKQNE